MEDIDLLREEEAIHQIINLIFKNLDNISCKFLLKENVRH